MSPRQRWLLVILFAAAMAWVESAAVFYLWVKLDRVVPHQAQPLPPAPAVGVLSFGAVELVREAATLVMLLTIGGLAGQTTRSRWGYMLIAFGAWDILYYVFLIPMSGWPQSLFDWDILFLIPLPWWGPVLIATLMIIGGTLISQFDQPGRPLWPGRTALALNFIGIGLALYVFMANALHAWPRMNLVRQVEPTWFNWPLFSLALILLAAPVVDVGRQLLTPPKLMESL
jgi:hypothetical protein